ncbi:MAG TPA: MGMT family protein [Bacteroidales bacterium]|nr:MGMT family protein [Bacteroidales bacterium]HOK74019.1 MGMT family protein [Bacteroidales bacterium]HOM40811.1 MGMT family protein [Bacteroidales bacterium]HPP92525.1 MGMT family protein [Bacteroidales bacterium]HRR15661.1 MGMT family protein [Bacteroidales bacterium]
MSKSNRSQNISFFERVYEVVRQIPYGRVTSYGAIARYLGTGQSARMVGWALNVCNHAAIPAHRVVNRNGLLTGKHHFGTPLLMQQLLENEGLIIEDDRILNFHERFWDPSKELSSLNKFCHNTKND